MQLLEIQIIASGLTVVYAIIGFQFSLDPAEGLSFYFISECGMLFFYVLDKHIIKIYGQDGRNSQASTQPRAVIEAHLPTKDSKTRGYFPSHPLEARPLLDQVKFFKIITRLGAASDTRGRERKNIQVFLANLRHARPAYLNMESNPSLSTMDRMKNLVELRTRIQ